MNNSIVFLATVLSAMSLQAHATSFSFGSLEVVGGESTKERRTLDFIVNDNQILYIEKKTEVMGSLRSGSANEAQKLRIEGQKALEVLATVGSIVRDHELKETSFEEGRRVFASGSSFFRIEWESEERRMDVVAEKPLRYPAAVNFERAVLALVRDLLAEHADLVERTYQATEADDATPIELSLADLLAEPEKYAGKRVRVSGVLIWDFEHRALYPTLMDLWRSRYEKSVWLGEFSSFAEQQKVPSGNWRRRSVEGVVSTLNHGHGALWRCSIERLTKVGRE